MQIPMRLLSVLVLALLVAACGSTSNSNGASTTSSGVIQGSVVGTGSQEVAVQSMGAATSTSASSTFLLTNVPQGAATLQFSGGGHNAVLTMTPMVSGEFRHMTVSVAGDNATEESEQTETEFEGTVSAIEGTVLTVAGRQVAVTDATKIRKDDAAATFADLTAGTPVEVEGTLNADGTVTASEISIEDKNQADRIAFVGTLDQITGNTLTVGGVTVNVTSTTVIVKGDTILTLADLKVGDHLLVRGLVQADKSVNATRIRVLQGDDGEPEEMHVAGQISALDATTFTVGDTKIATDANTKFEGIGFTSLADLKVGDFALAEVVKQADGSLLAKEVMKFTPPVSTPVPPKPSM